MSLGRAPCSTQWVQDLQGIWGEVVLQGASCPGSWRVSCNGSARRRKAWGNAAPMSWRCGEPFHGSARSRAAALGGDRRPATRRGTAGSAPVPTRSSNRSKAERGQLRHALAGQPGRHGRDGRVRRSELGRDDFGAAGAVDGVEQRLNTRSVHRRLTATSSAAAARESAGSGTRARPRP